MAQAATGGNLMAAVAYALALSDASFGENESDHLEQCEKIQQAVQRNHGEDVGPWEWHFPSLEDAESAVRQIRQAGVDFREVRIRLVSASTGAVLPS